MLSADSLFVARLGDYPHYLDEVVGWQHHQWSQSLCLPLSVGVAEGDVQRRKASFNQHLSAEAFPETLLSFSQHKAVGCVSIVNDYANSGDTHKWVTNLYVIPECRCRGVGQNLLRHVDAYAKSWGVKTLQLATFDKQPYFTARGWSFVAQSTVNQQELSVLQKGLSSCE